MKYVKVLLVQNIHRAINKADRCGPIPLGGWVPDKCQNVIRHFVDNEETDSESDDILEDDNSVLSQHSRQAAAPLTILTGEASPLHPASNKHPTNLSYSAVAQNSSKTLARPSVQPGSPAGWGAMDPTRAESESGDNEDDN